MCKDCIYYVYDNSTGQANCKQFDNMTDEEIETYFTNDITGCPYQGIEQQHNKPLTIKQVNIMFEAKENVRLKNMIK